MKAIPEEPTEDQMKEALLACDPKRVRPELGIFEKIEQCADLIFKASATRGLLDSDMFNTLGVPLDHLLLLQEVEATASLPSVRRAK